MTHELHTLLTVQSKVCRLCKQHALTASTAAHACLPYPGCARGQINQRQLAKKLVTKFARRLSRERLVNARSQIQNFLT